jgi:hypothetical protein
VLGVKQEQEQAAAEREAREEKKNYHGPRWWEKERA